MDGGSCRGSSNEMNRNTSKLCLNCKGEIIELNPAGEDVYSLIDLPGAIAVLSIVMSGKAYLFVSYLCCKKYKNGCGMKIIFIHSMCYYHR
jgi:hypothetical protein